MKYKPISVDAYGIRVRNTKGISDCIQCKYYDVNDDDDTPCYDCVTYFTFYLPDDQVKDVTVDSLTDIPITEGGQTYLNNVKKYFK